MSFDPVAYKMALRQVEASNDPWAVGPSQGMTGGGATGLYQLTGTTAAALARKYPQLGEYAGMSPAAILQKIRGNPQEQEKFQDALIQDQRQTIQNLGGDPDDAKAHIMLHRFGTRAAKEYISGAMNPDEVRTEDQNFSESPSDYLAKVQRAGLNLDAPSKKPVEQLAKLSLPGPPEQAPQVFGHDYTGGVGQPIVPVQAAVMRGNRVEPPMPFNRDTAPPPPGYTEQYESGPLPRDMAPPPEMLASLGVQPYTPYDKEPKASTPNLNKREQRFAKKLSDPEWRRQNPVKAGRMERELRSITGGQNPFLDALFGRPRQETT